MTELPVCGSVFFCLSLSRSRAPEQAKKQTDEPQTRANTRLQALNAQEGSREQRERNGRKCAGNGNFGRCVLKRPRPETAPTLGERAKKSQPDKGWDFTLWWSWGDLNPRPQAFFEQFYMCSRLFWISPPEPRSGTLPRTPATLDLTARQVARRATSLCK